VAAKNSTVMRLSRYLSMIVMPSRTLSQLRTLTQILRRHCVNF
jgi:hypothetical protein